MKLSRALTALALITAAGGILWRDRVRTASAADSDGTTWGATDPTWAPDGRRLGFSLYGSVWEVPVDGGEARQISNSPGYHAHPAWSPEGDRIAFIRGSPRISA